MSRRFTSLLTAFLLVAFTPLQAEPNYSRQADVIYGRKFGLALTMDVLRPKQNANGLGVIFVMSGGWFSNPPGGKLAGWAAPLVDAGYTIFQVVHGSQPKFTNLDATEDVLRAVRFIRANASNYGVNPDRLGITGGSAGGHLSLMAGTLGKDGDPKAKDPSERVSSRVQAVACFFPPTDFLNYGKPGEDAIGRGILANFAAAFEYREFDGAKKKFVTITDDARYVELGRKASPAYHVTAQSAPALIVHGDKDLLVPLQQGELMVEKLKAAGVDAELVVEPGAAHGWPNMEKHGPQFVAWFDKHLKR
jgi:acetyl esterase/lipase